MKPRTACKARIFNDSEFILNGDAEPDFKNESVTFLADISNMPYGNYPLVKKEDFLAELILNSVRKFLVVDNPSFPTLPQLSSFFKNDSIS